MTSPDDTPPTIGERIRADRNARELNQEQLAEAVGTNRRQVIRWEKNDNAPDAKYAPLLAKFFKRPDDYFASTPPAEAVADPRVDEVLRLLREIQRHLGLGGEGSGS